MQEFVSRIGITVKICREMLTAERTLSAEKQRNKVPSKLLAFLVALLRSGRNSA